MTLSPLIIIILIKNQVFTNDQKLLKEEPLRKCKD